MNTFLIIWALIAALFIAWNITCLQRVKEVGIFLNDILKKVDKKCKADVSAGREWRWRYDELDKLSFNEMCNKFWRPLESFIKDDKFIK